MKHFDIQRLIEARPPTVMTVREQTRIRERSSNLAWRSIFPRADVGSVKFDQMLVTSNDVAADRREWQGPARKLPGLETKYKGFEMNPIGSEFQLGERELQSLGERFNGDGGDATEQLAADLPRRVTYHVNSVYNRLELDSFESWLHGRITVVNPSTGRRVIAGLDLDDGAYILEDWTSANAYQRFMAALENAVMRFGQYPTGAIAPLKAINKIRADGPKVQGAEMTRGQLRRRIADEIGQEFAFLSEERTIEVATGGSTESFEPKKVWRRGSLAFIPPQRSIGDSFHAPIYRAQDHVPDLDDSDVDVNGVRVIYTKEDGGKTLKVETQLNAAPLPREDRTHVYVMGIN